MSVPVSSINRIMVSIEDENDFQSLESLSNRAMKAKIEFTCNIKEIYDPN